MLEKSTCFASFSIRRQRAPGDHEADRADSPLLHPAEVLLGQQALRHDAEELLGRVGRLGLFGGCVGAAAGDSQGEDAGGRCRGKQSFHRREG